MPDDATLMDNNRDRFQLRSAINAELTGYLCSSGRKADDVRVLDWGCGRGQTVLHLRERGMEAYGLDIDPQSVARGRELATALGIDPQALALLADDGRAPFPDDFFDFVFSSSVLEHVRDLDLVAAEIARVTRPGGAGMHVFPARRRIVEPHFGVPFAHWLPKNKVRYYWILAYVSFRHVLPDTPKWRKGAGPTRRAQANYESSVYQMYYPSIKKAKAAFEGADLRPEFDAMRSPGIAQLSLVSATAGSPIARKTVNWLIQRLVQVHMIVAAPAER